MVNHRHKNDFLTRGFNRFIGEILQGAKGRQYLNILNPKSRLKTRSFRGT
jgi:hypothetical protein